MVTFSIDVDDETAALLNREAKERGTTVKQLLAAGAHLVLNVGGEYELSEEDERRIAEADAEADRGEVTTHEEMMKKIRALRE